MHPGHGWRQLQAPQRADMEGWVVGRRGEVPPNAPKTHDPSLSVGQTPVAGAWDRAGARSCVRPAGPVDR